MNSNQYDMERITYVSEKVFEEMRRLKKEHDLPVEFVYQYLDNGSMYVMMLLDESDYWLSIWLEEKSKGRFEHCTLIKTYLAAHNSKVVSIMENKFIKHALPIEMTIGQTHDLKKDVSVMFVEEDMLLVSWLVMSSIDKYLNSHRRKESHD